MEGVQNRLLEVICTFENNYLIGELTFGDPLQDSGVEGTVNFGFAISLFLIRRSISLLFGQFSDFLWRTGEVWEHSLEV